MFSQSLILVQCWLVVLLCLLRVWFWFRVDHCRPLMSTQSLILVQSWPLSSSYVYLEFDFDSELIIVVLLCFLRAWFWFRVDHCRPLMFSQSLILVQSWPLSSAYVYSEFDFGSELTIVVLLCLLRVWFWFSIEHCRPLMFTQSLILVQSWPLSSSYVYSEFNFGSELTIVVLLCFLSLILVQSWPLSSSYVFSEFDVGSVFTIVVLLCLLRVWFWFRVDHCRPLMFTQSLILVQCWTLSSSYVFSEFDFGSELTIVVLLCFLRVWFWFRVDHCRPLMFTQSLILVQSWPGIVVLLCLLRVWFWFRVDHCRPLMFSQSLILVQCWTLSSSYVYSEFDFGSELTIVVLLCFLRVWFWFRDDHCRPLMFSQSLILVQIWPLSSSYVFSEFDFGSVLNIVVLLCLLRVWFWFSVEHCRPLMFTQSLILVQSWPLSSSYVYSEFDFGSELTIVVLLCLLRVWFWFRIDHCRPLMSTQSLILVQSLPLSSSYVYLEFDFGSELTRHCRPLMFTQSLILVQSWPLSSSYVFPEFDFGSELTIVVLLCLLRVWFWFRVDHCRPFMFTQSLILVQSWPLSSSYVYSEFDFGSELTIVVLLCFPRVWFWFRVDHCRPLMFSQSLILVQSWPLSSSYVFPEFDFGSELTIVVLLCLLRVWFWFRVDHCRPLMFTQSLILVQSWPLSSSYVYSEFDFGSELTIVVLLCFPRVWFWFRVDHCRPLMFSQSLILVQSWPLSSSYVYSEFNFGSELTIVVLLCFLSLILVQSWPLSSSYVFSEFDFGSVLTIVVLLCLLRVWFSFRVDHFRPLMFTQSLILVQSWSLLSSYVFSEFDFGSELTIVVLLCFLRV